jgi:hypothetical protein
MKRALRACNARLYVAIRGIYSNSARDNHVVPCSF